MKRDLKCDMDVQIVRAHRMGSRKSNRPRTIVAKFGDSDERWKVLTSTRNLKDTQFGVSEQFPPEIVQRRRELLPIFKEAKRRGLKASLVVDRLYVNDRRCYPGDDPFVDSRQYHTQRPSYAKVVEQGGDRQPQKIRRTDENL